LFPPQDAYLLLHASIRNQAAMALASAMASDGPATAHPPLSRASSLKPQASSSSLSAVPAASPTTEIVLALPTTPATKTPFKKTTSVKAETFTDTSTTASEAAETAEAAATLEAEALAAAEEASSTEPDSLFYDALINYNMSILRDTVVAVNVDEEHLEDDFYVDAEEKPRALVSLKDGHDMPSSFYLNAATLSMEQYLVSLLQSRKDADRSSAADAFLTVPDGSYPAYVR
jgi:hypothetical protein